MKPVILLAFVTSALGAAIPAPTSVAPSETAYNATEIPDIKLPNQREPITPEMFPEEIRPCLIATASNNTTMKSYKLHGKTIEKICREKGESHRAFGKFERYVFTSLRQECSAPQWDAMTRFYEGVAEQCMERWYNLPGNHDWAYQAGVQEKSGEKDAAKGESDEDSDDD